MMHSKTTGVALAAILSTLSMVSPAGAQDPAPAPAAGGKTITLTNEGGKCGPFRPLLEANKDQIQNLCAPGEKPKAEANTQGCAEGDVISVKITCPGPAAGEAAAPAPAPGAAPAPAAGGEASGSASAGIKIRPAGPPPVVVRRVTTPVVVSGIIAGAGLASGIVFGIMAAADNSSYKDTPNDEVARAGEDKAFIADVSFGVAALFGFAALALYFLPDEQQAPPPPPAADPAAAPPPAAKNHRVLFPSLASVLKGEVLRF
jgi:hypothetical protein